MTIINNQHNKKDFAFAIPTLLAMIVVLATSGIFIYNQNVNLNHEISKAKNTLQLAEVRNADLKTGLDSVAGQEKMKEVVGMDALIIEKNPEYVKAQLLAKEN